MLLPFAGDTAAQHFGWIATDDGVFLFKNALEAAHGTDGCVGREDGSLGYHDMASKPDMMGDLNGAVGVAPIAVAAEKTMLVGVHKCTAPRGLHMVVESNLVVADNEGRGTKVEMVAKGENTVFRHFDACTRSHGTLAKNVQGAPDVERWAMIAEIGLLAGGEAYFDESYTQSVSMEDNMA